MPAFLNNHAKSRARSVQLDSTVITERITTPKRESAATPPTPADRSSSLPDQENQIPSVRHYRSMLVVDAPSLGPHKPITYDELYLSQPTPGTLLWTSSCNLLLGIIIRFLLYYNCLC